MYRAVPIDCEIAVAVHHALTVHETNGRHGRQPLPLCSAENCSTGEKVLTVSRDGVAHEGVPA